MEVPEQLVGDKNNLLQVLHILVKRAIKRPQIEEIQIQVGFDKKLKKLNVQITTSERIYEPLFETLGKICFELKNANLKTLQDPETPKITKKRTLCGLIIRKLMGNISIREQKTKEGTIRNIITFTMFMSD